MQGGSRCRRAREPGVDASLRIAVALAVTSILLAACSGSDGSPSPTIARGSSPASPPATSSPTSAPPRPVVTVAVRGVTVSLCRACIALARREGVELAVLVRTDLGRITALLPRMRTRVDVTLRRGSGPPAGVDGYTQGWTGRVHVSLYARAREPVAALRTWLPFTLAHELAHAARVLRGPGIGNTLLDWLVAEGIADRFAGEAFPSLPPSAGDHALSTQQMIDLWGRALPRLRERQTLGRLRGWFAGRDGIPRWTGYTLGYHIVSGYLEREPGSTAVDLVTVRAGRILAVSRFPP